MVQFRTRQKFQRHTPIENYWPKKHFNVNAIVELFCQRFKVPWRLSGNQVSVICYIVLATRIHPYNLKFLSIYLNVTRKLVCLSLSCHVALMAISRCQVCNLIKMNNSCPTRHLHYQTGLFLLLPVFGNKPSKTSSIISRTPRVWVPDTPSEHHPEHPHVHRHWPQKLIPIRKWIEMFGTIKSYNGLNSETAWAQISTCQNLKKFSKDSILGLLILQEWLAHSVIIPLLEDE